MMSAKIFQRMKRILTDPHLLRAIFRSYNGRENLLDECERNNELRYENAGGCANMGNWLKAELERWGNRTKFLRLIPFRVSPFPENYSRMSVRCKSLVLFLQRHATELLDLSSPQEWVMKKLDKELPGTTLNTLVVPRSMEQEVDSVSMWTEERKSAFFIPSNMGGQGWTTRRKSLIRQAEQQFVKELGLLYEFDFSLNID